ncbi:hypothetical protein HZS_1615 [Henneguya salminicola]|nr:hypothetical protein HZS_1615 [Henneguya salminicola]
MIIGTKGVLKLNTFKNSAEKVSSIFLNHLNDDRIINTLIVKHHSGTISINFNSATIYDEKYFFLKKSVLRIIVVGGHKLSSVSWRNFVINDERLHEDISNYVEKIYHGSIVILLSTLVEDIFDHSIVDYISHLSNCKAEKFFEHKFDVIAFVRGNPNLGCYEKYYIDNEIEQDLVLGVLPHEPPVLDFACLLDPNKKKESQRRIAFCNKFFAFPDYCRCIC